MVNLIHTCKGGIVGEYFIVGVIWVMPYKRKKGCLCTTTTNTKVVNGEHYEQISKY
jgi:hypothetical protein